MNDAILLLDYFKILLDKILKNFLQKLNFNFTENFQVLHLLEIPNHDLIFLSINDLDRRVF